MKTLAHVLIAGFAALALCASALAQVPALQHDPFVRPAIGGFAPPPPPGPARPGATGVAPARPKLQLHAVLVAGSDSLANVDGVMVRIGESVQGYRLVEVTDRTAVLEKNNAKVTLTLRAKGEGAPVMKREDGK